MNLRQGLSALLTGIALAVAPYQAEARDISQKGVNMIKGFEGYRAQLYDDRGALAIGYGHRIKPGENYSKINERKAEELLRGDVADADGIVDEYVMVNLTQGQHDALVSITYNIGPQNLKKSTLLRKVNQKDFEGAAKEFLKWAKSNGQTLKGLVRRRTQEMNMFLGN